ncbi:hypothetical protein [Curtobacterium sp. MCBA15_005]|uniref:hypothetical protein n=1 Tax=Curtobacterium sp. MCBA15_005 TaxID=1898734 RepID=UPI0011136FBF|nr:hypothetical protein [Curtobacterium sp. MCBA15_005]
MSGDAADRLPRGFGPRICEGDRRSSLSASTHASEGFECAGEYFTTEQVEPEHVVEDDAAWVNDCRRAMSMTVRSRDVVGIPPTTTRSPLRIRPV